MAWFVSRLVVGAAWEPARNPFTFSPPLWARIDSGNYFAIAQHGRTFGVCGSKGFPWNPITLGLHLRLCGTAAWLPGYPWLIRIVHFAGIPWLDAALLIPWLATAIAIFLVWFGWGRDLHPSRAFLVMVLFALFPGSVFNFALYPTSVALACTVGAILAAVRERFAVAALLMTAGGLCYPSVWYAAIGLIVGLVVVALPLGSAVVANRALWGLAGLGAVAVLGINDWIAFGHADIYLRMQSQPGLETPGFPGENFVRLLLTRNTVEQKVIGRFGGTVLAIQGLAAVVTSGAGASLTARRWRRGERDPAVLYPAVGALTLTLVLLLTPGQTYWDRGVVLAAPCVVCLRRVPIPVLVTLLVVVGTATSLISTSFFRGVLV